MGEISLTDERKRLGAINLIVDSFYWPDASLYSVFILPLVYVPAPAAMKNLPFVRHLFVIQIGRL